MVLYFGVCKAQKARKQQQPNFGHRPKLPTIHLATRLASSSEYGWSFMPTTSPNMGPLQGIPGMPCEGGHLVLTLQINPHLATFHGLS
jgi:hypothetical protein